MTEILLPLPRCRKCGAAPKIARDYTIVVERVCWAVHCTNENCYNDTHWQFSSIAAEAIWRRNPCHGVRGGQGDPLDDLVLVDS